MVPLQTSRVIGRALRDVHEPVDNSINFNTLSARWRVGHWQTTPARVAVGRRVLWIMGESVTPVCDFGL